MPQEGPLHSSPSKRNRLLSYQPGSLFFSSHSSFLTSVPPELSSLRPQEPHLLGEDDTPIQKGRNQVMHHQMHLGCAVLLKVLVHLEPMDHAAGEHAVGLPALVIL